MVKLKKRIAQSFNLDLRYYFLVKHKLPRLYNLAAAVEHWLKGRKIRLDVSSVCQLKCPACSTASGRNKEGIVGYGHLKLKNFERLVDENPEVKSIEVSNWGEIFLNPKIKHILRYAHQKGVRLSAANGVNLNTVKDEILEALVKYRFHYMSVSIDGASQESYSKYRIGGNYDTVIANIERINFYKQKYYSPFPKMAWQFIIFGHNEHEIPAGREKARELGMRFKPKLNHTPVVSPVQDEEFVRAEGGFGVASRSEFREKKKREYSFPCGQLWSNPQVNWDGKMLGCCVNKWGSFGDVFKNGLQPVLKSEKYTYAQSMILGLSPPRLDIPCFSCKTYWQINPELDRAQLETELREARAAARAQVTADR